MVVIIFIFRYYFITFYNMIFIIITSYYFLFLIKMCDGIIYMYAYYISMYIPGHAKAACGLRRPGCGDRASLEKKQCFQWPAEYIGHCSLQGHVVPRGTSSTHLEHEHAPDDA